MIRRELKSLNTCKRVCDSRQQGEKEKIKCLLYLKRSHCVDTAPEGLAGFYVSDVTWNKTQEDEEDEEPEEDTDDEVTILSLIPIKKTKKGFTPLDKEKARNAGWAKLTLNL